MDRDRDDLRTSMYSDRDMYTDRDTYDTYQYEYDGDLYRYRDYGSRGYDTDRYNYEYEENDVDWLSVVAGVLLTAAGSYLIYRGVAHEEARSYYDDRYDQRQDERGKGVHVRESVTVNKPVSEVYSYWRNIENLGSIMSYLESVTRLETSVGRERSHWVAKGPAGMRLEWDAEQVEDRENELISWRSVEGADVPNEGSVRFSEAPGGQGTEVRVSLTYHPPGGALGSAVARLFGREPSQEIASDLRRFKQRFETGEISTTKGQSSGS